MPFSINPVNGPIYFFKNIEFELKTHLAFLKNLASKVFKVKKTEENFLFTTDSRNVEQYADSLSFESFSLSPLSSSLSESLELSTSVGNVSTESAKK